MSLAPVSEPSFANFFAGPNAQVVKAVEAVVAGDADSLHIWGPAGVGRSHLLRAAEAHAIRLGRPAAWVGRDDPERSMQQPLALVIADDVDRLDAREQLDAFALIDGARLRGARVLTAARTPAHELTLREDLRTRLAQSSSLHLAPLSDQDKRQAIAAHAARRALPLGGETVEYIIARVDRDMGSLMRVLESLEETSLREHRAINVPLAREVLQGLGF